MTRVKICGIKETEHARAALDAGADFLGFIFYPPSHRYVNPEAVAEIVSACRQSHGERERWRSVGVFVDEPVERVHAILGIAGLDIAQLCGGETVGYCQQIDRPVLRVTHVAENGGMTLDGDARELGAWRLLLDTKVDGMFGGTGHTFDWSAVQETARESFLAGGLTIHNVGSAVRSAQPWAVDVSGGVERDRVKDPALIRAFIQEVRRVDRHDP